MKRLSKRKTKEPETSTPYYKLVLLGENGVGKTQLLHRLNEENYDKNYCPTFGLDFRIKTIKDENGNPLNDIQMIDIPGETDELHKSIENDYIQSAHAFLVVFDVSNEFSVINAVSIKDKYASKIIKNPGLKKWYLIGNKKDKDSSGKNIPPQYKDKFDNYFEVSSKTSITSVFDDILEQIVKDLDDVYRENRYVNNDSDEEKEDFEIDFIKAHGDIFNEECEIF